MAAMLERRPDVGKAAGIAQVFKVVYREHLAHGPAQAHHIIVNLLQRIAAVAALDRQHHQQALAQRRAQRIHRTDRALRELLAQLAGSEFRLAIGTADAGGHADIQDILAALQHGAHGFQVRLGRDLGGGHLFALAHRVVKRGAVEALGVQAGAVRAADHIMKRDRQHIVLFQPAAVQVGRCIRNDRKHDPSPRNKSNTRYQITAASIINQEKFLSRYSCFLFRM